MHALRPRRADVSHLTVRLFQEHWVPVNLRSKEDVGLLAEVLAIVVLRWRLSWLAVK